MRARCVLFLQAFLVFIYLICLRGYVGEESCIPMPLEFLEMNLLTFTCMFEYEYEYDDDNDNDDDNDDSDEN